MCMSMKLRMDIKFWSFFHFQLTAEDQEILHSNHFYRRRRENLPALYDTVNKLSAAGTVKLKCMSKIMGALEKDTFLFPCSPGPSYGTKVQRLLF